MSLSSSHPSPLTSAAASFDRETGVRRAAWPRRAGTILLVGLLALYSHVFRTECRIQRLREPMTDAELAADIPAGSSLRFVSLGHYEALADLVWLDALSFLGATFGRSRDPSWLDEHIEAITTLDPSFRLVYEWAGAVIMYGSRIDNRSVLASSRVLEEGIRKFPGDWVLHAMLGVNYAFELRPATEEQRVEWRSVGARHLARASRLPGAPPYLQLAATALLRRQSQWNDAVANVTRAWLVEPDATAVRSLRAQAESLLPPAEAGELLAERLVLLGSSRSPRFRLLGSELALVVHPEPSYLLPPVALSEPEFHATR